MKGLQKLLSLSLDRTPASELLPITVGAWVEVIANKGDFDQELDAPRFQAAFLTLATNRGTWPAPKDFLEALPSRSQLKLTKTVIPASPERAAAAIAEALKTLNMDRKTAAAGGDS